MNKVKRSLFTVISKLFPRTITSSSLIITKVLRRIRSIFLYPPALIVVLVQRIISPFVQLRISSIDLGRIGTYYNVAYAKHSRLNERWDFYYAHPHSLPCCNLYWANMWKRKVRVLPFSHFFHTVNTINSKVSGRKKYCVPTMHEIFDNDEVMARLFTERQSYLSFTDEEKSKGRKELERLDLKENEYVCIHNRDSSYLKTQYPERNLSYHDYRNSQISTYLKCANHLISHDLKIVRVGNIVESHLDKNNSKIIEFAKLNNNSEFLDIYLAAKCKIYVSTDTGLSVLPVIFDRPTVFVNYVPFQRLQISCHQAIFIPVRFYSNQLKRELSLKEASQLGLGTIAESSLLTDLNVKIIYNTENEILEAVDEMYQRIEGTWHQSPQDNQLQAKAWDIVRPKHLRSPDFRFGAKFLRDCPHILG